MPQVTGAMTSRELVVEISTNGTVWTGVSGAATNITPSGGGRTTGETYTYDGDNPIITVGKIQPFELGVTAVYTEGTSDLFETVRPIFESGGDLWMRWAPRGGQSGEFMFTTGAGKVTALTYPSSPANDGAPIMTGMTWRGQRPTKSTIV